MTKLLIKRVILMKFILNFLNIALNSQFELNTLTLYSGKIYIFSIYCTKRLSKNLQSKAQYCII